MAERVLTVNAGSSSLKLALFEAGAPPRRVASHASRLDSAEGDPGASLEQGLAALGVELGALAGVGHRVVHGGPRYSGPEVLTPEVLAALAALAPLDPDHLPAALALVSALRASAPGIRQVACFDTAFHRAMPRVARLLAIPRRFEAEGVERYGFHGLSYTFLLAELSRVAGPVIARGRVVLAHLGSGASLAAVREGRCVDTTMAFTPNSGVPMSTRSGDLDPGLVLYLLRACGGDAGRLDDLLSRRSGLLGVSDTTGDMSALLANRERDPRAADAVDVFCHAVRRAVGALAATLGGLDTLVFAGGIGENAPSVRAQVARGLEHLGIRLDPARNEAGAAVITSDASPCTVRIMHTDEESVIASETFRLLGDLP